MPYSRGDVVLVLSRFKSPHRKRRPALVVQADNLSTGLSQTIVAMITSNLGRAGHPSRVSVSLAAAEGRQTGLLNDSVIMTDNLATILDPGIDRRIGSMLNLAAVDTALRHTLKL